MSFSRRVGALYAKDLRIELRTREILYTSALFSAVLVTVFVFAGFSERELAPWTAPGLIWVSIAFVGSIIFSRTFQRERDGRVIEGLLMVPGILDALFVSKLLVNLTLLLAVQALLVPSILLLFGISVDFSIGTFLAVLFVGTLGFCILGTVLAASLAAVELREVLLPLILYPLCIPLFIAGIKATSLLFRPDLEVGSTTDWLNMMIAFDLLFLAIGRWLFGEAVDGGESGT